MCTNSISKNQFFIGALLGDGGFVKKTEGHNTYVVFKQSEDQYQYLNWKFETVRKYGLMREDGRGITMVNIKEGQTYPNYQNQYRFRTVSSAELNRYKLMTCEQIVEEIDVPAFVIWLLDDGNVYRNTIKISCGDKPREMCISIMNKIKTVLNVDMFYYEHPVNTAKNYIRIPARCFDRVLESVLLYIPMSLDVMADKFSLVQESAITVNVKYHTDQLKLCCIDGKSDWIDLRAAERVEMKTGDFRIISLGVSMKLPVGYEAHIVPRSSTFKKWGILQANSVGIIDNSYCGDNDVWMFPALAMRETVINEGDRICQFRIIKKMDSVEFREVDHLNDPDRGGFGSTGER